jgi:hypothetical protein
MLYHNIKMLHAALDHPSTHAKHAKLVNKRSPDPRAHEVYMRHPCNRPVRAVMAGTGWSACGSEDGVGGVFGVGVGERGAETARRAYDEHVDHDDGAWLGEVLGGKVRIRTLFCRRLKA